MAANYFIRNSNKNQKKVKKRNRIIAYIISSIFIIEIILSFAIFTLGIESTAEKNCFDTIEENTEQLSSMFAKVIEQNKAQLDLFGDVIESNYDKLDLVLETYIKNFCEAQVFSAICLHMQDGTQVSYGNHTHESKYSSMEKEIEHLPYISDVVSVDGSRERNDQYIYIATAVSLGQDAPNAILYGFISLETFPKFVSTTAYNKNGEFYIVDGNTGNYLMDEYHLDADGSKSELGNMFETGISTAKTKDGYTPEKMRDDIRSGKKGFYVFRSNNTDDWHYICYMPIEHELLEGKNWCMQMTIDEDTAFQIFDDVTYAVFLLLGVISIIAVMALIALIIRFRIRRRNDEEILHRSEYMNAVQQELIGAHNDPDFVDKALRVVGEEMKAESALLLMFKDKKVTGIQHWPSYDKPQVESLLGVNIRDVFPKIYDSILSGRAFYFDEKFASVTPTETEMMVFSELDIRNIIVVPIRTASGTLKGVLATVNMPVEKRKTELLECVSKDFFLALTNLENHMIIKNMGEIDYLTRIKNRNRYETDILEFATMNAEVLWCIFIDVNGLHDLNNRLGHKAGDIMLCAVADIMRKIFGDRHVYRLGGDEFVAFKINSTHEMFMSYKHRFIEELERTGYSAAVGFSSVKKNENRVFDVERVVAEAEEYMYREKREYYEKSGVTR